MIDVYPRKYGVDPPLDSNQYRSWLQKQTTVTSAPGTNVHVEQQTTPSSESATEPLSSAPGTTASDPTQPAYPPSFAELVDMITQNKPIPGIEEIPDTVIPDSSLTSLPQDVSSERTAPPQGRRKPWEKTASIEEPVSEGSGKGSQLLDILQT